MKSLSWQNENKSATRGVKFVPIGIPTICMYTKSNVIKRHIHSDKTEVYTLYGM